MRIACLLSFFLFLFLTSGCKDNDDVTPDNSVFGTLWQSTSTKINEANTYTYTYKPVETLKSSFGIEAIRIERNGTFTRHTFGPADEGLTISGAWTSTDNQMFKVKPTNARYPEFSFVIESLQDGTLQARYLF